MEAGWGLLESHGDGLSVINRVPKGKAAIATANSYQCGLLCFASGAVTLPNRQRACCD